MSSVMITIGVYMNMQITQMVQDDGIFEIEKGEIGQITSNLIVYSVPFTIVTLCFTSYAFEILGRKYTLFLSFLSTSGLFYLMPRASPSLNKLIVVRCLIGVSMAAPTAHPLIVDYVHKKSRGRAIASTGVGLVVGEVFAMGVLYNLTRHMTYNHAFNVASLMILAFSLFFLVSIKDPDMSSLHRNMNQKLQDDDD